jgi:acyl-CoA thioesterase-1
MVAAYGRRRVVQKVACWGLACLLLAKGAWAAPIKLLTFGDSLTAGYGLPRADGFEAQLGAALKRAGFEVVILDGGVSGDTSAGGRARIDWALADKPDAAIVELGGNDGLRGLPVAQMQANLAGILDRLDQAHVTTLLTGMYPPPNLGAEYTRDFRAAFDRLSRRPGLLYDPFFLQGVALHPALIQADGIHPNAQGVAIIVARLLPMVEQLLRSVGAR